MAQVSKPARKPGFFANIGSLVSARAFLALSQILVLPIVARYISVEEFAIMALAMTVVVFCTVLSDAGFGRSLIRTKGYNPEEWSSVFWFLFGIGVALAGMTVALSVVWAWFFVEPALVPVLSSLAIVPLCQAISATPNAEIERRENYTGIAKVQILTTVISLGLAVILALNGAGVWALVAQQVALAVVRLLGLAALTTFRPQPIFKPALLGGHVQFAMDSLKVSAIYAVGQQSVVMFIGKLLGNVPLGIFSMSQRFSRLPQFGLAGPMSTVVYVRMAKNQDDPDRLIAIYFASIWILGFAIMPAMGIVAAVGEALFTVFLSADWAQVAPVFALSIGGLAIEAVAVVCLVCLFRAKGRTELTVKLAIESALLRMALVLIGAMFSLEAVAGALAVWGILIVPRAWHIAKSVVPLSTRDALGALVPSCAIGLVIFVLHKTFAQILAPSHLLEIALAFAVWAIVMLGAAWKWWSPIQASIAEFKKN